MTPFFLRVLRVLADPIATIRNWYLCEVFLPLVKSGGDINRINVRLAQADFRETRLILEAMGARIHPTAHIETNLLIHNARPDYRNLHIGAHSYVGKDCLFDLAESVILEDDVTLAMRVTVVTHFDAGHSPVSEFYPRSDMPVIIKRGAYIAAGAIILPGLTINEGALVAARAMVREDVPARAVVAGNPARLIKTMSVGPSQEASVSGTRMEKI
jgi:acetyltransferase-like isoleucine patch superfamily enzyme